MVNDGHLPCFSARFWTSPLDFGFRVIEFIYSSCVWLHSKSCLWLNFCLFDVSWTQISFRFEKKKLWSPLINLEHIRAIFGFRHPKYNKNSIIYRTIIQIYVTDLDLEPIESILKLFICKLWRMRLPMMYIKFDSVLPRVQDALLLMMSLQFMTKACAVLMSSHSSYHIVDEKDDVRT